MSRMHEQPEEESHELTRPADRWVFVGLLLILAWLPLPWASHGELAQAMAGIGVSLLLCCWLLLCAAGRVPLAPGRWRPLLPALLLWTAWACWIALQLLPLSCGVLAALSPSALEVHRSAAAALGDDVSCITAPLSIAPGVTAGQLIVTGFYFALYVLVFLLVTSRRRLRAVLWTLALSGLFQALYGMHMSITGLEYGFLEKKTFGLGVATGTFVNRDHYAAYLEITLAAGIGLVLADLGRWRTRNLSDFLSDLIALLFSAKFRARVMLVAMVAALVLTRSRMGNIAFFIALGASGGLYVLLRYRRWFLPSMLLFASLLMVDLMVVSKWFGLSAVVQRIEQTELETESRSLVLTDLRPAIADYFVTGSGLGTFPLAYAPYRDESIRAYFDHAHNEYAEFLVESGIVGVSLLGLLLLAHVWHAVRVMLNRRTPIYAAAAFASLMAIAAMAAHGLAEFMLHTPAVAATLVTLMALGMGVPSRSPRKRRIRPDANDVEESAHAA